MKKLRCNKGFSLVELIIVIAIMAILVGVMAPQLIRYIEKAKVSADTQRLDTLHSAITYALMDPEVISDGNNSTKYWISDLTSPNQLSFGWEASYYGDRLTCKFAETVGEVVGYNPWTTPLAEHGYESTPRDGQKLLPKIVVNSTGNAFAIYLDNSDRTGHKDGEAFSGGYDDLEDSKVIFVK